MSNFDLEDRTLKFSKEVISYCRKFKIDLYTKNVIEQLLRSSTSIGANYIEANDALGKKDFAHRLKIARKESKETIYWLNILEDTIGSDVTLQRLKSECIELRNILSSIINKV